MTTTQELQKKLGASPRFLRNCLGMKVVSPERAGMSFREEDDEEFVERPVVVFASNEFSSIDDDVDFEEPMDAEFNYHDWDSAVPVLN